jgi:hypothetical protein
VSVVLADPIVGPARGDDHGQAGGPDVDRRVAWTDRSGDRRDRLRRDVVAGDGLLHSAGGPPTPARFAARVGFLKNEVFEICGALALAESLLARLGLPGEAAYLATVFDVVEGRLVEPGPTAS